MNLFDTLLEIKTGKKDLPMKAAYIPNSTASGEGSYFIYYYDISKHTFYINDLNKPCEDNLRTSAIDIIEQILNQAYKQEMNSFINLLREIQSRKKPKVICISYQKKTGIIVIDKVNIKTIRWDNWEVLGYKNPSCNNSNGEKLKLLKEKILSKF